MTAASEVAEDRVERASVSSELTPAFRRLAEAASRAAVAQLSHKVDGLIRGMEEYAGSGGATERAAVEGLKAYLLGKNPVWMAAKGAWRGASVQARVVAVLVLLLVLLLAPVALLLLLLGLLGAAVVAAVRAASR